MTDGGGVRPALTRRELRERHEAMIPRMRLRRVRGAVAGAAVCIVALPSMLLGAAGMPPVARGQESRIPIVAQTYTVGDVVTPDVDRDSYAATTAEERDRIVAEREAQERRREAVLASAGQAAAFYDGDVALNWPLAGSFVISDLFGTRDGAHEGVDLAASTGTPVFAAAAGTVRVSTDAYSGYGVAIVIDHVIDGTVVSTLYGHMGYGTRVVRAGQAVEAGQRIGSVGNTGRSFGPHLHFEVQLGKTAVDPLPWLG